MTNRLSVESTQRTLKRDTGCSLGWRWDQENRSLSNTKFGEVRQVSILDDESGKVLWDQPVHIEPVGAICVPITKSGKIRLRRQFRPTVHPGGVEQQFPEVLPEGEWGREFLGVARGFPEKGESEEKTARRETEEETSVAVLGVERIGEINANAAFFHHMIPVFVVYINEDFKGDLPGDINEVILEGFDCPVDRVRRLISGAHIQDALDISAISLYLFWQESQQE